MLSASEALERLRAGNARFVAGVRDDGTGVGQARRYELREAQAPFAVILGCSDSRAPAEILFDQGLGDLFVIRVAGNVVAPSQIGSVEFALERFGTRLVVVLGHTRCGAVGATLEELERPSEARSPNLRSIVDRIRPSLEGLIDAGLEPGSEAMARAAIRANIRASTNQLRHGSHIIEQLVGSEGLVVVGAEYSLDSGEVEFFDLA
jgi:carbonic anhydrase